MGESGRKVRILSLDGGGAWALIQILALRDIYASRLGKSPDAVTGHEVLADFDLVVANSGGSISAGALYSNITLTQALQFFLDEAWRRRIFVSLPGPVASVTRWLGFGPRYVAKKKEAGLRAVFGPEGSGGAGGFAIADLALPELPPLGLGTIGRRLPDLLIVGFDYRRRRAQFFRSATASPNGGPARVSLAEAVHVSSNAPVNYFDAPAMVGDRPFWDGAISGYNNPILAGLTEALALPGVTAAGVEVRSIGTGSVLLPQAADPPDDVLWEAYPSTSFGASVKTLATAILDDPPDAASYIAYVYLGGPLPDAGVSGGLVGRRADGSVPVVRLSPLVQPLYVPGVTGSGGQYVLPPGWTREEFRFLRNLDMDAVGNKEVQAIQTLAERWLASSGSVVNQPIRGRRDTFEVEIGHRWAAQAIADWGALGR
jgi:hypothetical protein